MTMVDNPRDHNLQILQNGTVQVAGQFMWGSNYTFLAKVETQGESLLAVYKPLRGERPLWDFPPGSLAAREVAAYLTSRALGWDLVPPTVLREDGPAGPGSLQLYLDIDPERHYFNFSDEERQRLRPVVAFDVLINNADRKSGHILLGSDDHLWLIDHGICFHRDHKLRTVVWDFVGQPIPQDILKDLRAFRNHLTSNDELASAFAELLSQGEIEAMTVRAEQLITEGRFPEPDGVRPYPWPLV
ncbi:MAG TPA: SCO1664 family protein [Anaerolineae bacterium]|nr:SCO1664 family protein [Anaerolineae bacterium]